MPPPLNGRPKRGRGIGALPRSQTNVSLGISYYRDHVLDNLDGRQCLAQPLKREPGPARALRQMRLAKVDSKPRPSPFSETRDTEEVMANESYRARFSQQLQSLNNV